jgi:putative membrane protein
MTELLLANHHWGGGIWFPVFPLFFLALWITVFVLFGRRWRHSDRRAGESVLAERFARGEITENEYRERREVLRKR